MEINQCVGLSDCRVDGVQYWPFRPTIADCSAAAVTLEVLVKSKQLRAARVPTNALLSGLHKGSLRRITPSQRRMSDDVKAAMTLEVGRALSVGQA